MTFLLFFKINALITLERHSTTKKAATEGFYGDTLLVNGCERSLYIEVSRGWIRLRLVNASNARRYELSANDGRSLYLIASDQGLLTSPVELKSIPMAPGERT